MAAPALRIPLSINMQEFEKGIESAKGHTRQATQFILKQFVDMNASLGGPAAAGLAAGFGASALRLVGIFGAVVGAVKLTGDAIQATRDRLVEMVDVADKAQSKGVSAEFFQSFISGAKGAEERIAMFETALDRAFQATKPLLNPDWSVWDSGITKISAVEKAMRDTRELFTTDQNFSGFDLFKNATNQDEKIKAVLRYMQQLKMIGQETAALDIGEKMFGSQFTDRVRQGKESFDKMLVTLDSGSKLNFISNDAAKNAKELDDKLNDAWHTISDRMKPDWDDLANIALRIKGIWASIIEAVATYKANEIKARPFENSSSNDSVNDPDPERAAFGSPAILNQGRRRRGQLPVLPVAPTVPSEAAALDVWSAANDFSGGPPAPDGVPMPRRRPIDAPKPPPAAAIVRDPFEVSVDQIEKRIAALKAETATIDAGTAAQERAKTVAVLEEAAKRANTAAGLANKEVTAAQRIEIEKEADAMARAAAASEKARIGSGIKFGTNTALLSPEDVQIAAQLKGLYPDVATALNSVEAAAMRTNSAMRTMSDSIQGNLVSGLTDILDGTKSASQGFRDMGKSVLRAIDEMIIKMLIVAPIARALQSALSGFSLFGPALPGTASSPFFGPVAPAGIGANAEGTDNWRGGPTWVGEKGPEIVNLPRGAQVVPNAVAARSGGGGTTIANTFMVAGDVSPGTIERLQNAVLAAHRKADGLTKIITSTQRMQSTGVG